jgi:choline dehydrogenase-like flavoprotein
VSGLADATLFAYRRIVSGSLHIPTGAPAHLQLDMEQTPARENCVRLSEQRDAFGRRVASIRWEVASRDYAEISEAAERIVSMWSMHCAGLPRLHLRRTYGESHNPHGAYHPVGTCRMGEDSEAVVDHALKVHNLQNLWVCSTAVLPSAGTANPTFTLLCLAQGLVQRLCAIH